MTNSIRVLEDRAGMVTLIDCWVRNEDRFKSKAGRQDEYLIVFHFDAASLKDFMSCNQRWGLKIQYFMR